MLDKDYFSNGFQEQARGLREYTMEIHLEAGDVYLVHSVTRADQNYLLFKAYALDGTALPATYQGEKREHTRLAVPYARISKVVLTDRRYLPPAPPPPPGMGFQHVWAIYHGDAEQE